MYDSKMMMDLSEKWVACYRRKPVLTILSSVAVMVCGTLVGQYLAYREKIQIQELRREYSNFDNQLSRLEETEENLQDLITFVKEQKAAVETTKI